MKGYKKTYPFLKRKAEAERIRAKYPDRIPLIVEKHHSSDVEAMDKTKFLVPCDLTVGQFIYVVRKRLKLNQNHALFLFIGNTMISGHIILSQVYQENKDEDGFLYCEYSGENCFG